MQLIFGGKKMNQEKLPEIKPKGSALIPFLVFIVIYLGVGLLLQSQGVEMAFYQFPSVAAMFIALIFAFFMTKGPFIERFKIFSSGAAKTDIIMMLMIYLLAGAFSQVSAVMGGRDATVNLGLSVVPVPFLAAGIFVISAFMGTATGTSMGTVGAIVPIAVGVAAKSGVSLPVIVGACVGGAMFGDNLSMISDTTIAATTSQGCEMRDKFKMNFLIAVPAALVTVVILLIFGRPEAVADMGDLSFNFLKVVPYLVVLILALCGINVFVVLSGGIFLSGIIGMATGSINVFEFAQAIWDGFTGMNEVFFLTLFCAGMAEMITANGGLAWIIQKLKKMMKGQKSAELGIAALVSLTDLATANNTIAIVVTGKVAKDISSEFDVDPRKSASLLDIFSCVFQGVIPYGAQLLSAAALTNATIDGAGVSSMDFVPYVWYVWVLLVFALVDIFIPYADKTRKAK